MGTTSYAVALGSNRRHGRHGDPKQVIEAALRALTDHGVDVVARSRLIATAPMGNTGRRFANAAAIVRSPLGPTALLALLKTLEHAFGRRGGKRWGPRVLDLDILFQFPGAGLGPAFHERRPSPGQSRGSLILPHPGIATRDFVLQPLAEIAPRWRHPHAGLTVRQLRGRLHRATPVDRSTPHA